MITAALGIFTFIAGSVSAQVQEVSRVKILPGPERGIVKVHYANEVTSPLEIKFLTDRGVVGVDRISGTFPNGVSRKYNVKNLTNDFRIEISSAQLTLTYLIVPSGNWRTFKSYLEKTTYNHDVVATNN